MRFSDAFNRDWDFYVANADKFDFCGCDVRTLPYSADGKSAKECFWSIDSLGWKKSPACREPELLKRALVCKASVNWHIKQWADGWLDIGMSVDEMLDEFEGPVPDWVRHALLNQIDKKHAEMKATGFPNWWPKAWVLKLF